jgi:alkanesulfonate monooxygenase SsuD/methylene tetrahydromethanopterin reductase-like flavin-dependent oxidoreductase (luciferase family)
VTPPVGLLNQMWAEPSIADRDVLHGAADDVLLAEDLGFDSVMFGEHHFQQGGEFYGRIPVPELLLANLSAKTSRIGLGTGVKVLALDAPWRTAEAMVLLDHLSDGRAFWGLGQGTAPKVFPAGTTDERRYEMFREHLVALVGVLRCEDGALPEPISPVPQRDLTERIWVAARDRTTIELAAALGLNYVVGQAEQALAQSDLVEHYRRAGGTGQTRGVRTVHVAATDAEAVAAVRPALELYAARMSRGKYFQQAVARGIHAAGIDTELDELLRRMSVCCGSPESVVRQLNDYQRITGVDRVDVMFHLPGLSTAALHRSMRLFAAEVLPYLDASDDGR